MSAGGEIKRIHAEARRWLHAELAQSQVPGENTNALLVGWLMSAAEDLQSQPVPCTFVFVPCRQDGSNDHVGRVAGRAPNRSSLEFQQNLIARRVTIQPR